MFCPEPVAVSGSGKFDNLPLGKIGSLVEQILDCEVNYNMWTLMHRYFKARDLFKSGLFEISSRDHMAYFYIWLRFSFSRQLTWQRSFNTKPKELQHSQQCLIEEMCQQYKQTLSLPAEYTQEEFLSSADILRSIFSFIGKGSGNG
mmetsp:Transcript_7821/g.13109  ORF Transcript_7821/g.13109 Transcript_7821/m.13109 type:complete len:146 (-) Transcript_7821:2401-2838(-)